MNKLIISIGLLFALTGFACSSNGSKVSGDNIPESDLTNSTSLEVPVYKPLPENYSQEIDEAGRIEAITYSTQDASGNTISKTAHVYVPYQYNSNKQYNIVYLMHGGGGNNSTLMGNTNNPTSLKFILDNMIKNQDIEPVIVVTPSFYINNPNEGMDRLNDLTHNFQNELKNDLIPAVEGKYSTFAESTSVEDLTSSRAHRVFSGFSMGGVTTWYALAENLAYFQNFIPSSGDCWGVEQMGGRSKPQETAQYLANSIEEQGYSPLDLFIYAITGTEDMAYENLTPQIEAMKTLSEVFIYDHDPAKGNLFYIEAENGLHEYDWYNTYLYDVLPYIFN